VEGCLGLPEGHLRLRFAVPGFLHISEHLFLHAFVNAGGLGVCSSTVVAALVWATAIQ
jgi:homospermidine synthase